MNHDMRHNNTLSELESVSCMSKCTWFIFQNIFFFLSLGLEQVHPATPQKTRTVQNFLSCTVSNVP